MTLSLDNPVTDPDTAPIRRTVKGQTLSHAPKAPVALDALRQALLCLYRPDDLAQCTIALRLVPRAHDRGTALRRLLLDAVETLRPTGRVAPTASEYRAHQCLTLRYVDGLAIEEISEELGLSPRQVYRDLRWGEERLCEVLARPPDASAKAPRSDALADEMSALSRSPERVDLARTLAEALSTIAPLAQSRGVVAYLREPVEPCIISATPGVMGEIVTQLLSALVQSGVPDIEAELRVEGDEIRLRLPAGEGEGPPRSGLLQSALQMAEAQGVRCHTEFEGRRCCLCLVFPRYGDRRVLVVEDNPAAFALYQRYLSNTDWEPVLAPDPRIAGDVAAAHGVEAVLLDIMMPNTDGWRVLQALRTDERTRALPVIICSVVDDPALGRALGATDYLTKPVSRPALLQALDRAVRRDSPA